MDLVIGKAHRAGAATVQVGDKLRQPVAHLQRGQLGGAAVEVGARRSRRGAGVGHFVGVARIHFDPRWREAQNPGHDQRDFGVQALAHLGPAVVDQHAAVGIDMHQCAGLVELRGGEADAELHRRECQPALQGGLHGVPSGDLGAARAVTAAFGKLGDQRLQDVVLHRHAVVRGVALGGSVKIAQAHIQRVQAQGSGDVAQDHFGHHHALRSAEAAKRRMALLVGFAAVGINRYMFQKIRVVGVEDGTVGDRAAEVGAEAAIHQLRHLQAENPAALVKADVVVVAEGMALAGDHEVVVAVQPQFHRPPQFARGQRRPYRQVPGLRFFPAKAPAHAAADHAHRVQRNVQRMRHPVLHFSGVLGTAVDQPLPVLLRQGVGDLSFQVKVFLPAHVQRSAHDMGRYGQGLCRIAPAHMHRRQNPVLLCHRVTHAQHCR